MKKISKLFLTAAFVTLLGVGAFTGASAVKEAKVEEAEAASTDTSLYIYFTRPSDWGDNVVRIHTWDGNGTPGTTWASAWQMKWAYDNEFGQAVFAWHPTNDQPLYSNIQFHNDNHGMQSDNLSAPTSSTHYFYNNGWKTMEPETLRIYLYDYDNKFGNGEVKVHAWNEQGDTAYSTQWSGVNMGVTAESAGNGRVYYADLLNAYNRFIFNVGGDANKTDTISRPTNGGNNNCYVLANNETVLDGKNTWWSNINYVWAHNFSQNLMDFRTTSKAAGEGRDSDGCKSLYNAAKQGYTAIYANSYALAQLNESFPDAIERLGKWALANGETFNPSAGTFTPNGRANIGFVAENNNSNNNTMTIVLVSLVAATAIGGFFFFKKKKISK